MTATKLDTTTKVETPSKPADPVRKSASSSLKEAADTAFGLLSLSMFFKTDNRIALLTLLVGVVRAVLEYKENLKVKSTGNDNKPEEEALVKLIETARSTTMLIAFTTPSYRLFSFLLVESLAGMTALESLFFGSLSARSKKWPINTPYQRQSACNNLATALVMLLTVALGADDAVLAALVLVAVTFVVLSGVNHVVTELRDDRPGRLAADIHYKRFFGSCSILVVVLVKIFVYWKPF